MCEFKEWLDGEITKLKETATDHNIFIQGKLSEAIRIRAVFNEFNLSPEDIAAKICDKFCKFPEAYDTGHDDDNERMIEEHCNNCPLGELVR